MKAKEKVNVEKRQQNGAIKKKKKRDNFEVKVPRIIVRNLGFKVTEEILKNTFEKTVKSNVANVSIVNKDGVSKGFGFVTFEKLEDAQKAVETMNGTKILGRPMAIDWSLPKNVYQQMQTKNPPKEIQGTSYGIQSNPKVDVPEIEEEEEEEMEVDDESDDEQIVEEEPKQKVRSNESSRDVREHRTLFVRNIPFDATQEELSKLLSSKTESKILSCLLVIDPVSKHPRGSAFVQFATRDQAEQCLNQSFSLRGQDLQLDFALGRQELAKARQIREEKFEKIKKNDQRNLALANYGVILSLDKLDGNENDLRKRQQLEDMKKEKLKNLLNFVSTTRLTVHNLPTNIDDKTLRNVILKALKKNGVPLKDVKITECRVMRKEKEAKKSLRYAFVTLSNHEHALRVIDSLNNNKFVFGPSRRPIVQFAIENRRALQLKEERRERLRAKQELMKNPTNDQIKFDNNTNKKKQKTRNVRDSQKIPVRLSQLIEEKPVADENQIVADDSIVKKKFGEPIEREIQIRKREKTKSKKEIRDRFDEMIRKTRMKPPLPEKKKKKWFE